MEIKIDKKDATLYVAAIGRLNTQTAPELEAKLNESITGINEIILDLAALDYISSAGLRVVLVIQNKMDEIGGSLVIKNAGQAIKEIFDMTGFTSILTLG